MIENIKKKKIMVGETGNRTDDKEKWTVFLKTLFVVVAAAAVTGHMEI